MKHHVKNLILALPLFLALGACATTVPNSTTYNYDVYQYKLNKSDFELVQKNLNGSKVSQQDDRLVTSINSARDYATFSDKMAKESFFSEYKYSYIHCQIIESSSLAAPDNQYCKYEYDGKNLVLELVSTKIEKNDIYYTIAAKGKAPTSGHNHVNEEYLMFTFKDDSQGGLFFIINKNWLSKPWSYYDKTPQAENNMQAPK